MKLRVIWPGKTRKDYYKAAINDYASRIQKLIPFEIVETSEVSVKDADWRRRRKTESDVLSRRIKAPLTVVLDPSGNQMSTEDFAHWLEKRQSDVDFILGGPHGLEAPPDAFRLSFGAMTVAHELARVVLLEQLYRALTILRGLPYHK